MIEESKVENNNLQRKSKRTGCLIAGSIGCLWFGFMFLIVAVIIGYFLYIEYIDPVDTYLNVNTNTSYLDTNNANYNHNLNSDYDEYDYNANENYNTNINIVDKYDSVDALDNGELVDEDGSSLGFSIDENVVTDDLYAYQVGAYADVDSSDTEWPAVRFTVDELENTPPLSEGNDGSLWVGALLDNDYFIQIGLMAMDDSDGDGNAEWGYFWEMWDDQDNYLYGLQEPLVSNDWDTSESNSFSMTCQDPVEGEWEFWVNDVVVGKTYTGSCDLALRNSYIFWELTTNEPGKDNLPEFGPFTIGGFEFWDGYTWAPITSAYLSYSYGLVKDGTLIDKESVCPPYGAEAIDGKDSFKVGSDLECLELYSDLW
ncbi:MAG: hypothetical protein Q8P90_04810 [bacterium]|nr:hypothetical protein [bacterium]